MRQMRLFDSGEDAESLGSVKLCLATDWRLRLLELLGGRCINCGQHERRLLDVDHVLNDGAQDRREGWRTSRKICRRASADESYRKRLQVLCAPCHAFKTRFGHVVPPMHMTGAEGIEVAALEPMMDAFRRVAASFGISQLAFTQAVGVFVRQAIRATDEHPNAIWPQTLRSLVDIARDFHNPDPRVPRYRITSH